jgi:hypothetical protein
MESQYNTWHCSTIRKVAVSFLDVVIVILFIDITLPAAILPGVGPASDINE